MSSSRPLHISSGTGALFAVHHRPDRTDAGKIPVLICSPWGWDDVASYRSRREWAGRLADAGHPTIRFDLPATGNSDGRPGDEGVVEAWVAAIADAATWLAAESKSPAVAALGLGLGGLLALESAGEGAPIIALALGGAPGSGRRFLRETRAFAGMQPWSSDAEDFDPGLAEGWIEAGGFLLSPETVAAISALTPKRIGGLRRILAFDRDGIAPDPKMLEALSGAGAAVRSAQGPGWGNFVSHPERSEFPAAVAGRLEEWLADATPVPRGRKRASSAVPAAAEPVTLAGREVEEKVVALGEAWGNTVGVSSEPSGGGDGDVCAVFLNAGAVREIGPSRMWAETARDWAETGVASLRVDLEGIGEADGEPSGTLRVGDFYLPRYGAQVAGILDEAERQGLGSRFVLVGLCAGGHWAFRAALAEDRVVAAFGINAGALLWHDDLQTQRVARLGGGRARDVDYWRKLLRGEVEFGKVLRLLRSLLRRAFVGPREAARRPFGRTRSQLLLEEIEGDLDRLAERDVPVLLAFSAKEPLGEEIEAYGLEKQGERWPNVDFESLPGSDHTLRPPVAQRAVHGLLDEALARARAGLDPDQGSTARQR